MIAGAGIDSWSPCWYLDPGSPAARMLDDLATVPSKRGMLLKRSVASHRVGWISAAGLLYAEGHPCGAMPGEFTPEPFLEADVDRARRHREDEARVPWLLSPDCLPVAYDGLVAALEASGVPVPPGRARDAFYAAQNLSEGVLEGWDREPGFAGLRRCDATVDVDTGSRSRGLAILAGVAGVATSVPRAQAGVRYARDGSGTVETVYLRGYGGVKILGRWYDKGLESGLAGRGLIVRAEDQRRYPKGHRRGIDELESAYVKAKFQQRWLPLWRATKGVTVAGTMVLADRLAEMVGAGELSAKQAETLAGFLVLSRSGVKQSRATGYRRKSALRDLGLVVAEGAIEEVQIDLHEVLDEALDSPAWGAQG
jgi:hypothetical protein